MWIAIAFAVGITLGIFANAVVVGAYKSVCRAIEKTAKLF